MAQFYIIVSIGLGSIASFIKIKIKGSRTNIKSQPDFNVDKETGTENKPIFSETNNQPNITTKSNKPSMAVKIILIILLFGIALVAAPKIVILFQDKGISDEIKEQDKNDNGERLASMALALCGEYSVVYTPKEYLGQGIFECKQTKYVYYIKDYNESSRLAGIYNIGEFYQIGYSYHEEIEKVFPGAIYLYRPTGIVGVKSELKIAVEAENEEDFIERYAEKFYQLIKNMNSQYKSELVLTVYFNKTLSGIESTYDKLFLSANYYAYNVNIGNSYREYVFEPGDPEDLFNNIFGNPSSYPTNARNALKNNKHIEMTINDGQTITLDEFIQRFKNSFQNSL